jgi:chromosome partitioning protein
MVWSLNGIKGGSGRSTTAANLFVFLQRLGNSVLAVDADPQKTFTHFLDVRRQQLEQPADPQIQLFGADLLPKLKPLLAKYDDVVIDCGGRDSAAQRAALTLADVCLVPVTPRATDRWTLDELYGLLDQAKQYNPKLRAFFFFSRTDFRGLTTTAVTNAADYLRPDSDWCHLLELPIANRVVFDKAIGDGLSVFEYVPPDAKAIAEATALVTYVQEAIK